MILIIFLRKDDKRGYADDIVIHDFKNNDLEQKIPILW